MPKRKLLTSGQLADELGISTRTVARYAREGLLRPAETTVGGHFRWDLQDVRHQMEELRKRYIGDRPHANPRSLGENPLSCVIAWVNVVCVRSHTVDGDKLRSIRELAGYTQVTLAKKIRRDRSQIAHWESGRYQPTAPAFRALCKALGVEAEELLVVPDETAA